MKIINMSLQGENMQFILEGGVNWGRGIEFTSIVILLVQWKATVRLYIPRRSLK
jgi:hypothetical protein